MNFAKKFKEVVIANFVEISHPEDENPESAAAADTLGEPASVSAATAPSAAVPPPFVAAAAQAPSMLPTLEPIPAPAAQPAAFVQPSPMAPLQPPAATPPQFPPIAVPGTANAGPAAQAAAPAPVAPPKSAADIPPVFPGLVSPEPGVPSPAAAPAAPALDAQRAALFAAAQGFADTFATAQSTEHAAIGDILDLISEDGSVDFDRWFAASGVAKRSTFTAEQALSILLSLPSDLPLRTKRQLLKTTLDAMGQAVGATTADVVADAEQKRARLDQFVEDVTARTTELCSEETETIARLKAEIAEREARVQDLENRRDRATALTQNRFDQFDQVIAFFTAADAGTTEQAHAAEESAYGDEDLPAFMREDAVFRMLGIDSESVGASSEGAG